MQTKNRSTRRPLPVIQLLDARYLFSVFHAVDYNPSGLGNTWVYTVNKDGSPGEDDRTSISVNGQFTLSDTLSIGDDRTFKTEAVIFSSAGISEGFAEEADQSTNTTTKVTPDPAYVYIPATFGTGVVSTWSDEKSNVTISANNGVFKGTVTDTGSLTVDGLVPVDGYPEALKSVTVHHFVTRLSNASGTITIDDNDTLTSYDVSGVGTVEDDDVSKTTTTAVDGTKTDATHEQTLSLDKSSLYPFENVGSGVIVSGTAGNDKIEIQHIGKQFIASCNGLSATYSAADVADGFEIYGGSGNDTIRVDSDVLLTYADGGEGNDSIVGSDGANVLTGGPGRDTIFGNGGDDRLNGDGGNDFLDGGAGNDRLYGIGGNDTLDGAGGLDKLDGGSGNDSLIGGSGNDSLLGESGNDTLEGQSGADSLDGGSGIDSATVETGIDSVANVETILS